MRESKGKTQHDGDDTPDFAPLPSLRRYFYPLPLCVPRRHAIHNADFALQYIYSMAGFERLQRGEINMRHLLLAVVVATGVSLIGVAAASAAPANGQALLKATDHASYVTKVAGGCGVGFHRDRWGHCVRN
jgi:hypothetical protein